MLARTHIALGYSSCLLITRPDSPSELLTCLGMSAIFSVISDVDATTSESKKELSKIVAATAAGIALIAAGDFFFDLGIFNRLQNSTELLRLFSAFIYFLVICIFGEHRPHRSFMHSFLGTAAMCAAVYVILPFGVKYAAVSILSHISADLLNKKKVQLFYPLKKFSFSLNLCHSDGAVNMFLFIFSATAAVFQTAYLILKFSGILTA